MIPAKTRRKLQKLLGDLQAKHGPGRGRCWICGSTSGTKTSRESYGTRCVRCVSLGHVTADTVEHERLKLALAMLKKSG